MEEQHPIPGQFGRDGICEARRSRITNHLDTACLHMLQGLFMWPGMLVVPGF